MSRAIGTRIIAMQNADETTAYIFGRGVYAGDEVPVDAAGFMGEVLREHGSTNPKLVLDNGDVVWGCECWWGDEESVLKKIGDREIVEVSIAESRAQCAAAEAARTPRDSGGIYG